MKNIENIIGELLKNSFDSEKIICTFQKPYPDKKSVAEMMNEIYYLIFPNLLITEYTNYKDLEDLLLSKTNKIRKILDEQVKRSLCFKCKESECKIQVNEIVENFFKKIPEVQNKLKKDVIAIYNCDPAAKSLEEVIICYPGLKAIFYYRIAHLLYEFNIPILPRIITEIAHSETGIDIHPGAEIGENFAIDHGTGIVIGETCKIGNNVRIYQGVTLGAKSFPLDSNGKPIKDIPRHPIIEDNVIIYANATILGRIVIGHDSIIGANEWVTYDVPPYSKISRFKKAKNI